jgi:hypothetical protein
MKSFLWVLLILFSGAPSTQCFAYTFDRTVPDSVKQQLLADLAFADAIRGEAASPLHQQIFGEKVDGPTYTEFFSSRVQAIGMNSCGSENAVACVNPLFGTNKIWLTPNYLKFSQPQIAKMMVLFHESRHTESKNDYWPHAQCPESFPEKSIWTGAPLAGQSACDVSAYGSYGSSLILLKNIQEHCTNCSDKVKMDAGLYADDQLKRIIDPGANQAIKKDLY